MPLGPEYKRKLDFVKLTKQLRASQPRVRENRAAAQATITLFADKIGALLDQQEVYSDMRCAYFAYAYALDSSQRRLKFMVDWIREHQILRNRFENRNLDPAILDTIDQLVIYRTKDE